MAMVLDVLMVGYMLRAQQIDGGCDMCGFGPYPSPHVSPQRYAKRLSSRARLIKGASFVRGDEPDEATTRVLQTSAASQSAYLCCVYFRTLVEA